MLLLNIMSILIIIAALAAAWFRYRATRSYVHAAIAGAVVFFALPLVLDQLTKLLE